MFNNMYGWYEKNDIHSIPGLCKVSSSNMQPPLLYYENVVKPL